MEEPSTDTVESVSKSSVTLQSVREKHQQVWMHGTKQDKQPRAGKGGPAAGLLQEQSGVIEYAYAMKKASRMCGVEPAAVHKPVPAEMQPGNAQAAKFLRLLKGHSSMRATSLKVRQGKLVSDALAQWKSGEQVEEPEERLHRPWHVLAGPCFSPQHFFQHRSRDCKLEILEDLPKVPKGPDVSGIPRPSDKLAFAHPHDSTNGTLPHPCVLQPFRPRRHRGVREATAQQQGSGASAQSVHPQGSRSKHRVPTATKCAAEMPREMHHGKVRKPTQEFLDEGLLRSVPVKVTYTAKHSLYGPCGAENAGTISRVASLQLLLRRLTTHSNSHERMKACMREIEQEALVLQGLHRASSEVPAMRLLVAHAVSKAAPGRAGARKSGARVSLPRQGSGARVAMHPAIEKVCSTRRTGAAGPEAAQHMHVDETLAASVGTRCLEA